MAEGGKKKVLIAEDEAPMARVLSDKFTREGFEVFTAGDGEAALQLALKERPDVILLDVVMPKMDGMTVMKKLREEGDWGKHVPLVVLTNLVANDNIMGRVIVDEPSYYLVKSETSIEDIVRKAKESIK
ncbi:response regulator [Candidatus Parcubacteria bacterium]|nr:MAG: response regulator [Candidatus Parcubacteria bacterium]